MSYGELIEHAERLHALAASRTGTRADLIQLRDLVPRWLLLCANSWISAAT